jgi:hypothetical protein
MCLCVHKALNDSDGDAVSLSVGTAEWMAPFLIYGKRGRRLHGEVCGAARIRPIRTWVSRHGPVPQDERPKKVKLGTAFFKKFSDMFLETGICKKNRSSA